MPKVGPCSPLDIARPRRQPTCPWKLHTMVTDGPGYFPLKSQVGVRGRGWYHRNRVSGDTAERDARFLWGLCEGRMCCRQQGACSPTGRGAGPASGRVVYLCLNRQPFLRLHSELKPKKEQKTTGCCFCNFALRCFVSLINLSRKK